MWDYTDKVRDHYLNPRNVGEIENPDGVGEVGNLKCGAGPEGFARNSPQRMMRVMSGPTGV